MLILKARHFLSGGTDAQHSASTGSPKRKAPRIQAQDRRVVVLDLYRGVKGRPIGMHVFDAIKNASDVGDSSRVHRIAFDVNDNASQIHFVGKVEGTARNITPTDTLFILDEVLPENCWSGILKALSKEFAKSQVWCADGLLPQRLSGFQDVCMPFIFRMPPTVQKLLYHADWDEDRKGYYSPDACTQHNNATASMPSSIQKASWGGGAGSGVQYHLTTNGPTPLCVLHEFHSFSKVLDCEQCANELAELLEVKMKMVEKQERSYEPFLPCSIAILYTVPWDYYSNDSSGMNLNEDKLKEYINLVECCPFISRLRQQLGVNVNVLTMDDMHQDLEQKSLWNVVQVGWADWFQGLERDVVIVLPSDTAVSGVSWSGREFRPHYPSAEQGPSEFHEWPVLPGFDASQKRFESPLLVRNRRPRSEIAAAVAVAEPTAAAAATAAKTSTTAALPLRSPPPSMSSYNWRIDHVKRYTPWDRRGLVFAVTRCSSQVILMVP